MMVASSSSVEPEMPMDARWRRRPPSPVWWPHCSRDSASRRAWRASLPSGRLARREKKLVARRCQWRERGARPNSA